MENFTIYFWLIFLAGVAIFSILNWYRNKEIQELKVVDLKILAAENNLIFTEEGGRLTRNLGRHDLLPGRAGKTKNILMSKTESYAVQIFDASFTIKKGKSSQTIDVTGILVSFDYFQFPRFDLKPAVTFDGFTLFDNMSKLDSHLLPEWIKPSQSIFYSKSAKPKGVSAFLANKKGLQSLLETPNFHLLAASEQNLVLYQRGVMPSSFGGYQHLRQKAQQLVDIFYPLTKGDAVSPDDIRLIKKTLKN